jgi:hypothetical protein
VLFAAAPSFHRDGEQPVLAAQLDHAAQVLVLRKLAGEQPAFQASDFVTIQVTQGIPHDRGRRPGMRAEPVPGQHLEGLGCVFVPHRIIQSPNQRITKSSNHKSTDHRLTRSRIIPRRKLVAEDLWQMNGYYRLMAS